MSPVIQLLNGCWRNFLWMDQLGLGLRRNWHGRAQPEQKCEQESGLPSGGHGHPPQPKLVDKCSLTWRVRCPGPVTKVTKGVTVTGTGRWPSGKETDRGSVSW